MGAAFAELLVAEGAQVVVGDVRDDEGAELVAGLGDAARYVHLDVTDPDDWTAAVGTAVAEFGKLNVLVNNAGIINGAPLQTFRLDKWRQILDVNLTGTFLCMQAALPDMLAARQGRIVNIASTAGQRGYAYVAAYVAAKHGVVGLTRSLALELATKGITVNAVCPGYTETEILRESIANVMAKTGRSEAEARAEFARGNPQGRIVQPQEVADAVQWLCSDAAGAITGQSISVSGGEVM